MNTPITIIGAGNMGSAIAKALVSAGGWKVTLVDRPGKKIKSISGVTQANSLRAGLTKAQIVLLAVKPQDGKEALQGMHDLIPKSAVLVSIMVGATLRGLARESGHTKVVRAMPNMPAQLGLGMTVWCASKRISTAQRKLVQRLFEACGEALGVKQERLIDAATAISGSGPAYVFALAEYMTAAGMQFGFSKTTAERVTAQTIWGAGQLLKQSGEDPGKLRQQVTSKKGTTEAAFDVFANRHTQQIYLAALKAAFARAKKVSKAWN